MIILCLYHELSNQQLPIVVNSCQQLPNNYHKMQQQKKNITNSEQQFRRIDKYAYSPSWKLGEGSFATVYRAVDINTSQNYAIKIIKLSSLTSKLTVTLLEQQISILQELDHENVIKCYDVINSSNNCYIVMEYCKFGDLSSLLKMKNKFEEDEISSYVYQIFKGFRYLQEKKILHRDFKPANVFINQRGICKIADFGFAIKYQEKFKDVALGSPFYMAPQIIYFKQYGLKIDVWAFGITLYELLNGNPPLFGVKTQQQLKEKVFLPICVNNFSISTQLKELISRCLKINQKQRISFEEMEKTEYIAEIINQCENQKLFQSSISETKSCSKSSRILYKTVMRKPVSYDQAVSLLQYCRFLSKICQSLHERSQIFQKWLLIMIKDLNKAKVRQNQLGNYKQLKQVIVSYSHRYRKQFRSEEKKVKIQNVIDECNRLMQDNKKIKQLLLMLQNQTQTLKEAMIHPLKLVYFVKNSNITEYLNKAAYTGIS